MSDFWKDYEPEPTRAAQSEPPCKTGGQCTSKCQQCVVQEPVAWISHNAGLYHFKPDESLDPLPLYLAPPAAKRQWVGLTDEEFEDIELGCRSTPFGKIEAMKKVEAKLKEKNT